jgi:hypothetical protein
MAMKRPVTDQGRYELFGWSQAQVHPENGLMVSRRGEMALSRDGRRLRGTLFYRTTHADGRQTIVTCPFSAPILSTEECLALFRRAGFDAKAFRGYKHMPDDGTDTIVCFVCTQ